MFRGVWCTHADKCLDEVLRYSHVDNSLEEVVWCTHEDKCLEEMMLSPCRKMFRGGDGITHVDKCLEEVVWWTM